MYLIIYDISETKLRTKVSKLLINEGYDRLQYSVFCGCFNPKKNSVWKKLNTFVKDKELSNIICIKISENNFFNLKSIGKFNHDLTYLIGKQKTIII